ncbi:MAG: serine/threonine protein kinase [Roseburia sp.]|nr:serine/threonine protein kinase [Roseburia sp.]
MLDINNIYENGKLFDGHYKLIDLLSTAGGSADVWLAIDVNTIDETNDESRATKVVIKIYRPKNLIDIEGEYQFRSEFKKVFSCHHENIIQPTYFNIYEEMPYLVLPYCPSGSSEMLIGQFEKKDDIWKYIYEVSSGLAYLHEHTPQIIHQDIKPANVLIDDNGNYAITDFGISAEMGGTDMESEDESGGTFAYMAPERFIEGTPPMPESDIWALGATLYELITGDAPFGNDGGSNQKKGTVIPPIKQNIPDPIKGLIYSCLAYTPKDRPTARSIVDTVLKKRYSRSKKTIVLISVIGIIIVAGITAFMTSRNKTSPEEHLNSLVARGDSISNVQFSIIEVSDTIDVESNIKELEKAIVLYNNVVKDAPLDYNDKQLVVEKIENTQQLIRELKEYDRARDLAETAQLCEMEEEYVEYSVIKEKHKITINQLIQNFK